MLENRGRLGRHTGIHASLLLHELPDFSLPVHISVAKPLAVVQDGILSYARDERFHRVRSHALTQKTTSLAAREPGGVVSTTSRRR